MRVLILYVSKGKTHKK